MDSGAIRLVMGLEFVRKNKFKKKKLEKLIYMRNVDGIFNHKRPIEYMIEVEFYKEHKERTEIYVVVGQK